MTLRTAALGVCALCIATVLCFFALRHYCYIVFWGQRTSDPDFVIYRLDDVERLVLGSDVALLINTKEHSVVSLSPGFGRRIGTVVVWPRDARGVLLGDGVKGDVEDSYHFVDGGVDIRYGLGTAKRDLHAPL